MPTFSPNQSVTATAKLPVKPAGMPCQAELYLGADKIATSGKIPFISTGVEQTVILPITMPGSGSYQALLDIFTEETLIGAFYGTEQVVISSPAWSFGTPSAIFDTELSYHIIEMSVQVSNNSPTPLSGKIYSCWDWDAPNQCRIRYWNNRIDYYQLSLGAWETKTVVSPFRYYYDGALKPNGPYVEGGNAVLWFSDDFGNMSPVVGPY